jgi:hypothetical protein
MTATKRAVLRENMTQALASEWLEVFTSEPNSEGETCKYLRWKKPSARCPEGSFAGSIRPSDEYYSVVLLGFNYSGKRLIHLIETGEWPAEREAVIRSAMQRDVRLAPVPLTAEQKAILRAKLRGGKV